MELLTPSSTSDATLTSPVATRSASATDDVTSQVFGNAKSSLHALAAVFEGFHVQTMQIRTADGASEGIAEFRQEMKTQEERHKEGLSEIQRIIDDLLQNQIVEQMRVEVELEISEQINEIVKEQVAECLKTFIPEDLQNEVEERKRELEQARLALHNSESRRLNGVLRSNRLEDPLHSLYMHNGSVSADFPKDLKSLFGLDADACKKLATEYELPNISDSRDRNLNRFMQFCGVRGII